MRWWDPSRGGGGEPTLMKNKKREKRSEGGGRDMDGMEAGTPFHQRGQRENHDEVDDGIGREELPRLAKS